MGRHLLTGGTLRNSPIVLNGPSGGTFPLAVDATKRHLVTAGGSAFYMVGDSPQGMLVNVPATDNVTSEDGGAYLAARKAQGFNTVWSNILCNTYTFGRADGSTFDGLTPFTGTVGGSPDLTTPRASYWARMDAWVQLVAKYGLLFVIDPIETGGWTDTAVANGTTRCNTYGQFLGNRYRGFPNVLWMSGNDFAGTNPPGAGSDAVILQVAAGLRAANPAALQTVELFYLNSDSFDDANWPPVIDLNAVYSYDPQYTYLRRGYNRTGPVMPTFYVEGSYEHESNSGAPVGTPLEIRRQVYYCLTNGATGNLYGEHNTSEMTTGGWSAYLGSPNSPGADHVGRFASFLGTIAWQNLVPDQSNTFLTGGQGSSGTTSYATAAKSADGHLGVVYVPFSTTAVVNLTLMAGPVTARWFDPTSGTYSTIGTGLIGSGHGFTYPGANGAGDPDRILLLEA